MRDSSLHALRFVFLALIAALLAGCEDMGSAKPARNFDELIPRMLGAMNKSTNPEEAAANLFNVTSPDERRDAIAYLETKPWGHQPPYMRAYELLATDPYAMVRAQAMRALGTSYQESAGTFLAKGLNDANPDQAAAVQVRRDAAYGLITTWNDSAIAPLIVHVHPQKDATAIPMDGEPDDLTRGYCARALSHFNTPQVMHALIDALRDKDAAVVYYAHQSLVTITHQDMAYDPNAWLAWVQQSQTPPANATAPATRPG